MNTWAILAPLVTLAVSIGVAAWIGETITKRTNKAAGWSTGVVLFFVIFAALSSFSTPA